MKRKKRNPQIYVAKQTPIKPAPREDLVKLVHEILKDKQFRYIKKHVKKISITRTSQIYGNVVLGCWDMQNEKVKIIDSDRSLKKYDDVIRHEFAHGEFHYLKKWNKEAFDNFVEIAKNHPPISTYTQKHQRKFKKYCNFDNVSLYADEQHSELTLRLSGKMSLHSPVNTISKELEEAYYKLHFM